MAGLQAEGSRGKLEMALNLPLGGLHPSLGGWGSSLTSLALCLPTQTPLGPRVLLAWLVPITHR